MSGQALQAELTSLAQEAKRKNPEIRTVCGIDCVLGNTCSDAVQAAEKSLQDLKSITVTSEAQLAAGEMRLPHEHHVR